MPPYTQWDNIYAAHRAFNDGDNRKKHRTTSSPTERRKAGWLIDRAEEDFKLFSSFVDIQDITSTEPFLINSAAHRVRARIAMRQQSPYSDEITGRALDMPLRMAFNFFVLEQPGPHGHPPQKTTSQSESHRARTIGLLEGAHIANFREVMLLGQRRIRQIEGIGPVSLGKTVECIEAIDARLSLPRDTYVTQAALLYEGDIDRVPARILTDIAPRKTKDLTVGGVLGMPRSALATTFGEHSEQVQDAAVSLEAAFNETEERQAWLAYESQLYIASLAPPEIPPLPEVR